MLNTKLVCEIYLYKVLVDSKVFQTTLLHVQIFNQSPGLDELIDPGVKERFVEF